MAHRRGGIFRRFALAVAPRPPLIGAAVALLLASFCAGATVRASEPAGAKAAGRITLELNRLDDAGEGCRMSFVMRNALGVTIEALAIELVLFDGTGQVVSLVSIDPGQLPEGKTRVKQFDIAGLACSGIGRVLVNDVPACKGEGLDPAACLAALEATSRTSVPLVE